MNNSFLPFWIIFCCSWSGSCTGRMEI